jgi:hypothetical protein
VSLSASQRRQAHLSGLSQDIAQHNLYLPNAFSDTSLAPKQIASTFQTVTNTAYWVYVGQSTRDLLATQIYFWVQTVGVGTLVQELVVATSVSGPDRAAKTLSVVAVANATGDYTAATGWYTNTTSLAYHLPAGTHTWLGCRFALTNTPTQPILTGVGLDQDQGAVLRTATPGVLAVGNYTGALVTQSTTLATAQGPALVLVAS